MPGRRSCPFPSPSARFTRNSRRTACNDISARGCAPLLRSWWMIVLHPKIRDAVLFFDLAGTLMPRTGFPREEQCTVLRDVARLADRFVLVTGQSADDPQVDFVMRNIGPVAGTRFVAY